MATKQEFSDEVVRQNGLDPARYELRDDGMIAEKQSPVHSSIPSSTATSTALHAARDNAGAVIGGVGVPAVGAMALPSIAAALGLSSGVGTIPTLAIMAGLGLAGSYGGNAIQDAAARAGTKEGEEFKGNWLKTGDAQAAKEKEEHPLAHLGGTTASLLIGGKPSLNQVKNLGTGLSTIAKTGLKGLAEGEKQALLNAGVQGGLQAGTGIYRKSQGQEIDPLEEAVGFGAGLAIGNPWWKKGNVARVQRTSDADLSKPIDHVQTELKAGGKVALDAVDNVPERPETIDVQAAMVRDQNLSAKKAILIPTGSKQLTPEQAAGLVPIKKVQGTLYINPLKYKGLDMTGIMNEKTPVDGRDLGYFSSSKPSAQDAMRIGVKAVTTKVAGVPDAITELVLDTPESIAAAVEHHKIYGGETTIAKPDDITLARKLDTRAADKAKKEADKVAAKAAKLTPSEEVLSPVEDPAEAAAAQERLMAAEKDNQLAEQERQKQVAANKQYLKDQEELRQATIRRDAAFQEGAAIQRKRAVNALLQQVEAVEQQNEAAVKAMEQQNKAGALPPGAKNIQLDPVNAPLKTAAEEVLSPIPTESLGSDVVERDTALPPRKGKVSELPIEERYKNNYQEADIAAMDPIDVMKLPATVIKQAVQDGDMDKLAKLYNKYHAASKLSFEYEDPRSGQLVTPVQAKHNAEYLLKLLAESKGYQTMQSEYNPLVHGTYGEFPNELYEGTHVGSRSQAAKVLREKAKSGAGVRAGYGKTVRQNIQKVAVDTKGKPFRTTDQGDWGEWNNLMEKHPNKDTFIYDNVEEGGGDSMMIRNPEQIKRLGFTFDDNGELIPLGERFNKQEPDNRYQQSAELPAEGSPVLRHNAKRMMALHGNEVYETGSKEAFTTPQDPTLRYGKQTPIGEGRSRIETSERAESALHEGQHAVLEAIPEWRERIKQLGLGEEEQVSLSAKELLNRIEKKDFGLWNDLKNTAKYYMGSDDPAVIRRMMQNAFVTGEIKPGGKVENIKYLKEAPKGEENYNKAQDSVYKYLVWEPSGKLKTAADGIDQIVKDDTKFYRGISELELKALQKDGTVKSLGEGNINKEGSYISDSPQLAGRFALVNMRDKGKGYILEIDKKLLQKVAPRDPGNFIADKIPLNAVSRIIDLSELSATPRSNYQAAAGSVVKQIPSEKARNSMEDAMNARTTYKGKLAYGIVRDLMKFPRELVQRVADKHLNYYRTGQATPISSEEAPVSKLLADHFDSIEKLQHSLGYERDINGNPFYIPETLSSDVHEALKKGKDSPMWGELVDAISDHWKNAGMPGSLAEIQAEAGKYLMGVAGARGGLFGAQDADGFAALHRAAGFGLPAKTASGITVREPDAVKAIMRYGENAAADMAWQEHVKNKMTPEEISAQESIAGGPWQVARDLYFNGEANTRPTLRAASRLASGMAIGPVSKLAEIASGPHNAALYGARPSDVVKAVKSVIADWGGSKTKATKAGIIKPGGVMDENFNTELGGNTTVRILTKAANELAHYTGTDFLERASRTLSYAFGEQTATSRLAAGDAKWFKERGVDINDPNAISKAATQMAELIQGRRDARELPEAMLKGPLADIAPIHRWAVGHSANLVTEMKNGNYSNFMWYLLGGLGVGVGRKYLNEFITKKKGAGPTLDELQASGKGLASMQGAGFVADILRSAGIGGALTDAADMAISSANGKKAQLLYNPLASAVQTGILELPGKLTEAINAGVPWDEAARLLADNVLRNSVQVWRVGEDLAKPQEQAERDSDRRDLRVYRQLTSDSAPFTGDFNPAIVAKSKAFQEAETGQEARDTFKEYEPVLRNKRKNAPASRISAPRDYVLPADENGQRERYAGYLQRQGDDTIGRKFRRSGRLENIKGYKEAMMEGSMSKL